VSKAIYSYLEQHGETVAASLAGVGGSSLIHMQSRLAVLARRGHVIRRKVTLKPDWGVQVWAYRLPHQEATMFSYEPKIGPEKPPKIPTEPEYSFVLRNLPRNEEELTWLTSRLGNQKTSSALPKRQASA
jgi:hypothetical protein